MSVKILRMPSPARFQAVLFVAALCATAAYGRNIEVDWTPNGVSEFRNYRTPLRTELGDSLILRCGQNVSNLFIQTDQIQYDTCNATAGSGMFDYNGFCLQGGSLMLTLTKNSQSLMNTVNFVDNSVYYLTSYSNGILRDADDETINSGGQCELGIRMIIIIGEVAPSSLPSPPPTTSTPPPPPDVSQVPVVVDDTQGDTDRKLLTAIAPAVAGTIVVLIIVITFTALLIKGFIVCYCNKSRKVSGDPLSHHVAINIDPSTQDKGFYSLVKGKDEQGSPSPSHSQTPVVRQDLRTFGIQPTQRNYYVDSPHLPVSRMSSQQSDEDEQQEELQNDYKDYVNSPSLPSPERDDEQEAWHNQHVSSPNLPVSKPSSPRSDRVHQVQRNYCVDSPSLPVSRLSSQQSSEVTVQRRYYVDSHNLPTSNPSNQYGDRVQQLMRNFCVDSPTSLPASRFSSQHEQQENRPYHLDSSPKLSSPQSSDAQQIMRRFFVDSPSFPDFSKLSSQHSDDRRPYSKTGQQFEHPDPSAVRRTSYDSDRSCPSPVLPSQLSRTFKTIDGHEESVPITFKPSMQAWRII